ncbi:F0F1 ATP synthase subunit B [Allonocardiopsis opalescens]|uniref:ATP synthase subunit b n=1 Tax=Allonocardiopsis opalescens TaxID=1144618 RepID=A0A2T0QD11_9ACTN|nr:F0F1 ATP synthase subunit B [Allonocardiopsis opalescens]PRY01788.1 ATP synthase F0 subcomplex B subunit [Allonocardiopsis opalescens]
MGLLAAEENHILMPHTSELVFGLIAFAIILFAFWTKILPRVTTTLDERADAIEGGIERAKAAEAEARETLQQYQAQLAEIRAERNAEIEKAKQQGAAIIAEMREQAQVEARKIVENAHAQIEAERQQAVARLRVEIGTLSTELAERIVGEALSDDAAQSRVIDRFLDELESQDRAGSQAEAR